MDYLLLISVIKVNMVWIFIFISKYVNADFILFFNFAKSLLWTGSFMPLKLSCYANSLSVFVIITGFLSTGFKYLQGIF